MKYGIIGSFIKFAFAKTAFEYLAKEMPEIEPGSYKKCLYGEVNRICEKPGCEMRMQILFNY